MSVYQFDEGVFELPEAAWEDQSINIIATPAPDGSNFGIVLTRHGLEGKSSLVAFVDAQLEEHEQTLRGYELIGRRDRVIGALPAVEVKLRWLNEGSAMFHYIAFIGHYGRALVITGSSLLKNAEACESLMEMVLPTLRLRER